MLREKIRDQNDEIRRLNATVQRLETEKEEMARVAGEEQTFAANKFAALLEYAEVLVASESRNKTLAREGYASALRHATIASELQRKQNQAIAALKTEMMRMIDVATKAAVLADSVPAVPVEDAMMMQQQQQQPVSPPKSRPTSPSPKKSRPTTAVKERSMSPSSPSPGKKRPTKGAEPVPIVVEPVPVPVPAVIVPSRPLPCLPPAESMAFCYYLATSFGVAEDKDMISLREMDEQLMMGDEDRQMLVLVAKQRLEAAIALAAAEAAEAAAAALKAAKAKTNKAAANKTGRSVSPSPVNPTGKGMDAKRGGSATAGAKKGGKAGKSPSPARGRTASPAKSNGAKAGKAGASPSPAAKGRASSPAKGGTKPNTSPPGKGNKSAPTKDKARSVSPGKKGK